MVGKGHHPRIIIKNIITLFYHTLDRLLIDSNGTFLLKFFISFNSYLIKLFGYQLQLRGDLIK